MPQKRKTAVEKAAAGTFRKKKAAADPETLGIHLLAEVPPIPENLKGISTAERIWRDVLPELVQSGRIAVEDMPLFEQATLGMCYLHWLDEQFLAIEGRANPMQYASLIATRQRILNHSVSLFEKFGMTARGRDRIMHLLVLQHEAGRQTLTERLEAAAQEGKS